MHPFNVFFFLKKIQIEDIHYNYKQSSIPNELSYKKKKSNELYEGV